jgi:5'-deoxynucleotidase YfbR-like HD superfamily hydrolase
MSRAPKIKTFTGKRFDLVDPDPATVDIVDIAHALSMQCRFTGHCREFYSVAQHSVLVCNQVASLLAPAKVTLAALLHDAAEAYTGDLSRPAKLAMGRTWLIFEHRIHCAIAYRFGFSTIYPLIVKEADDRMLATEMRDLTWQPGAGEPNEFLDDGDELPPPYADFVMEPIDQKAAFRLFMNRFAELED